MAKTLAVYGFTTVRMMFLFYIFLYSPFLLSVIIEGKLTYFLVGLRPRWLDWNRVMTFLVQMVARSLLTGGSEFDSLATLEYYYFIIGIYNWHRFGLTEN